MSTITAFSIIEKDSGSVLATLPLTVPIGATMDAYEQAGFDVKWSWSEIEVKE